MDPPLIKLAPGECLGAITRGAERRRARLVPVRRPSMRSDCFIGAPLRAPLPPLAPLALIIPCLQSAELCAWEYKKRVGGRGRKKCGTALQVPPSDTLHTDERIQLFPRPASCPPHLPVRSFLALVSNVILCHKARGRITCTHTRESHATRRPAKEARNGLP